MAIKATQTRLVVGSSTEAWDFSGVSNSLDVSLSGEKIENTRFQDTAKTYTTGDASGTIAQNGYFDNTSALNIDRWAMRQDGVTYGDTAYWAIVARVEASE